MEEGPRWEPPVALMEDTLVPSWRGHPHSMQPEWEHVAERLRLEKTAAGGRAALYIFGGYNFSKFKRTDVDL